MQPTEILFAEHRMIEQVLACLEQMAQEATDEREINRSSARDAADFFRDFADRFGIEKAALPDYYRCAHRTQDQP